MGALGGPWPALVKAALLGSERTGGPPTAAAGFGLVGRLVDELLDDRGRPPERVLLGAAAAVAAARRAGQLPLRPTAEAPPPAPPVDDPEVGDDAARTLAALLGGTWRQLLPEWLEACAAGGRRIPSVLLPAALDGATADRALRRPVLGVLGGRGRWLAGQRPEWGWALGAAAGEVPGDPGRAWSEGTAAERRTLLAAVRSTDPATGLALVESTWRADRADDRAAFVELLAVGLSMHDESFLEERARIDRARDVRRAAAAALARLPASRLAFRMQGRARAQVDLAVPAVRLPDELPEDWVADGVERVARGAEGERSWWLFQVLAATPLATWDPPGAGVAAASAAAGTDPTEVLLRGWGRAASRQHRADWAAALLAAGAGGDPAALLRILEPADRAAWLVQALGSAPPGRAAALLPLAAEVPRPWPPALVHVAAGRSAALVLASSTQAHAARPVLLQAAERADPEALPRFAAELAQAMQVDRRLQAELRRPLAIAQLRLDLLAELNRGEEPRPDSRR
ncbi:MAG: DUF5691 domain-containing protein [Acidimicrobiales bacterium]